MPVLRSLAVAALALASGVSAVRTSVARMEMDAGVESRRQELTQKKRGENDRIVKVKLLLTRHAFSCANAVSKFGKNMFGRRKHIWMSDPMLTQCGAHRSMRAAASMPEVDLVLSSSLLRAMETAAFQYPGHTIIPVPYISEESLGADNVPISVEEQQKRIKQGAAANDDRGKGLSDLKLDMQWMTHPVFGKSYARVRPSFLDFLDFLAKALLPTLPAQLAVKEELRIAVVTHSHFLKNVDIVKKKCSAFFEEKPRNNQVIELTFDYYAKMTIDMKGDKREPREVGIDPFAMKSDAIIPEIDRVLGGEGNLAEEILATKLPPWKANTFEVSVDRFLEPDDAAPCRSVYEAEPPPSDFCDADFGELCHQELQQLSSITRPTMAFSDQGLAEAQKKLEGSQTRVEKAKSRRATVSLKMAQDKVEAIQKIQCCV